MAAVNADVADVTAQLAAIRRRRNGLAAQRAGAAFTSVTLLGAALVTGTALRGSTEAFLLATGLAVVGLAACMIFLSWRTRRDWLSLPAAARLADDEATLHERLTTLLAVAPLTPAPPLRSLLVDQVIATRSRWHPDTLAPRRFSPWLALVPLAVAVFAATTFYARPPVTAAMRHFAASGSAMPVAPQVGSANAERPATALAGADRDARATSPGAIPSRPDMDGSAGPIGTMADAAANTAAGSAGDASPIAGATSRLRTLIQDTFGDGQNAGSQRRAADGTASAPSRSAGTNPETGDAQSSTHNAESPGEASSPTPQDRQRAQAAPSTSAAQESHGSGRGSANSGGTNGVLGGEGPSANGGVPGSAPVSIRLNAVSGVAPNRSEPQRQAGIPAGLASASRPEAGLPPLADDQVADVAVRPLAVSPEHEAIIRRLFTRE